MLSLIINTEIKSCRSCSSFYPFHSIHTWLKKKYNYINITNILFYYLGPLDPDYDDARIFKRAAAVGIKRALKAGSKKPLLVLEKNNFKHGQLVALLGALEVLYTVSIYYFIYDFEEMLLKLK